MDIISNAVDREPPLELNPAGETAFSEGAEGKVKEKDGEYFVTDAEGMFPYHRFNFKLDKAPAATDEVKVVWEGHSLPGRQVTMYTFAGDMVRNKQIHVLIQDLLLDYIDVNVYTQDTTGTPM
ncbi:hypothetical protein L1N85_06415 [Paenibacillus alkaliterrae]|uniref:hypothetical protein n=1 Tax=Paenibacillus alkaliterrae TaxID=320909 RepID=UPI001F39F301|nr:hypothetical protein [Paenibacillus alkaliterrae]MCF2938064.1 hypothetical protein [Paenibacillus alkaliterrae]